MVEGRWTANLLPSRTRVKLGHVKGVPLNLGTSGQECVDLTCSLATITELPPRPPFYYSKVKTLRSASAVVSRLPLRR